MILLQEDTAEQCSLLYQLDMEEVHLRLQHTHLLKNSRIQDVLKVAAHIYQPLPSLHYKNEKAQSETKFCQ